MITITFDGSGLEKKIVKMEGRVKNLRPFLKQVGDYLVKRTKSDFNDGGNPQWKENVFKTPTLVQSGKLRDSVKVLNIDETSVTVGTENKNFHHNFGYEYYPTFKQRRKFFQLLKESGMYNSSLKRSGNGKFTVPKRQFMKFQPQDEKFIADKLTRYIVKD